MVGAKAMALVALRRLIYVLTPNVAGASFSGIIHRLRPPVAASASRHYARMHNRNPPARKEVESDSDSTSSDEKEQMDPYPADDLESEELECFVLDFGAGEKEEEKRGGGEDA